MNLETIFRQSNIRQAMRACPEIKWLISEMEMRPNMDPATQELREILNQGPFALFLKVGEEDGYTVYACATHGLTAWKWHRNEGFYTSLVNKSEAVKLEARHLVDQYATKSEEIGDGGEYGIPIKVRQGDPFFVLY